MHQDFEDIDRCGIRVAAPRRRSDEQGRAFVCAGATQFRERQLHAGLGSRSRVVPHEHPDSLAPRSHARDLLDDRVRDAGAQEAGPFTAHRGEVHEGAGPTGHALESWRRGEARLDRPTAALEAGRGLALGHAHGADGQCAAHAGDARPA